ncbi:MAG: TonB family protein [Bryobacteraceae bacterium]
MAADYAAQPSDGAQPNDERLEPSAHAADAGGQSGPDSGDGAAEAHDLTYIRARRARANDPRRSVSAAFAGRNDPPSLVALRRAAPPPPSASPAPAPRSGLLGRSRAFWFLSAALFALVAGATFAVFYFRQTWVERAGVAPEVIHASVPVSSLQMHVEAQGDRVLVSWNPRASGVQAVASGRLTIADADQNREFPLDAAQAANGSVLYRPASGDVTFRLEIRNASGAVFNDSLRVLDPAKAALLAQKKAPVRPPAVAEHLAQPTVSRPLTRPVTALVGHVSANRVASAATPRRSETPGAANPVFHRIRSAQDGAERNLASSPERGSTRLTTGPLKMPATAPAISPPAQAVAASGGDLPAQVAPRALSSSAPPPAAANRQSRGQTGEVIGTVSVTHDSSGRQSERAAGMFLPPQAVQQVMPTLRSSLVRAIAPGTKVEVRVRIDTRGRVKRAEIAAISRNIDIGVQKAAVDAAKQWRFAPAWRNGEKVASEYTVVFQF